MDQFFSDELAYSVWLNKYALKDKNGNFSEKNPNDTILRLTREFHRIEMKYINPLTFKQIYDRLKDFKYIIPGGSPLYGIGNNNQISSISNCFVIESPYDSYGGIIRSDEELVSISKRRGGVGFDLGSLRPKDCTSNNSSTKVEGVRLFMKRYSNSCREVSQDSRRGALMLSLPVNHPDVLEFIDSKLDRSQITGANISVRIFDDFMNAVKNDDYYELTFNTHYEDISKRVKARVIWDKLVKNAWDSAEPGVLFWDRIINESPADLYKNYKTKSTNPCGEIPLCPYDSCRLLSINLFAYVEEVFTDNAYFNFSKFAEDVQIAQRLMDDIVDLEIEKVESIIAKINNDPEPEDIKSVELNLWHKILQKAKDGRRTGLGVMGLGDMLAGLGVRYGSEESLPIIESVFKEFAINSYKSSISMAEERGAFPAWDMDIELGKHDYLDRMKDMLSKSDPSFVDDWATIGRRNISNLTCAPTGTTSMLPSVTSGIEPAFKIYYKRRRKISGEQAGDRVDFIDEQGDKWQEYRVLHTGFIHWYSVISGNNFNDSKSFLLNINDTELNYLISKSPYYNATSFDTDVKIKVRMQGLIQKYIDHSISVTINLPNDVSPELVEELYMLAWESGCKGCTVYRDGSRTGVLIDNNENNKVNITEAIFTKRPKELKCDIYHISRGKNPFTVLVGLIEGKPYEVFAFDQLDHLVFNRNIKEGKVIRVKSGIYKLIGEYQGKEYTVENIIDLLNETEANQTRNFSTMLRYGIKPMVIIDQIEGYASISSFDKVIQKALSNYVNGENSAQSCPVCKQKLVMQDGCMKCLNCGFSKCG